MRRVFAALAIAASGALVVVPASAETPVTKTSRPVRLLRTWEETIKASGGREYVRRVELVFDYSAGVARENIYTPEGRLYGSRELRQNPPRPSEEEIAEAQDLVRRDPDLSRIVERRAAELDGGFLLEEERGKPCGPGSRCVLVQLLTADRQGLLRWTAVDLVERKVVYPVFVPRGVSR
jgi:hypothetical protein